MPPIELLVIIVGGLFLLWLGWQSKQSPPRTSDFTVSQVVGFTLILIAIAIYIAR